MFNAKDVFLREIFKMIRVTGPAAFVVSISAIVIRWLVGKEEFDRYANKPSTIFIAVAAGFVIVLIPMMIKFLQPPSKEYIPNFDIRNDAFRKLNHEVRLLKGQVDSVLKNKFSEADFVDKLSKVIDEHETVKEIERTVYEKTIVNLNTEIYSKLEKQFNAFSENQSNKKEIDTILQSFEDDIRSYLLRLQRNSIINLVIGVLATIASVVILIIALFTTREFDNIGEFLIHFLPRLLFVVSVQLFAFFFLRLYKNNLEDTKYFQNELTNMTAKTAAIKLAFIYNQTDKIAECVEKLSIVERNFKIGKDETLHAIETAKIDRDVDLAYIKGYQEYLYFLKQQQNTNK